jgi:hypothetical protein
VEESKEAGADAADASDDDSVSKSLSYGADDNNERVSSYQSFTFFLQLTINICNVMIT